MKVTVVRNLTVAAIVTVGFIASEVGAQTGAPAAQAATADIALWNGGTLLGQVVNHNGQPVSGIVVSLQYSGSQIAQAVSNEEGTFSVRGLRPGEHQVIISGQTNTYRLWPAKSAPEGVRPRLTLATPRRIVLGQLGSATPGGRPWPTLPRITLPVVAATVGIIGGIVWLSSDDDTPPVSP